MKNEKWEQNLPWTLALSVTSLPIGHFTVKDGSEGEGDLVSIQTFFALLWKLFLKNTSKHKNNLIYIIKQEGLYQNKVTLSLASIHNCKMALLTLFTIDADSFNLTSSDIPAILFFSSRRNAFLASWIATCAIF